MTRGGAKLAFRASLGVVFGFFLALTRAAQAEPLPVDLAWDAPSGCPTHDEVMAELARITRVRAGRVLTPIRAQATIEQGGEGRYHLRLRTQRDDQTGDTELDASTCLVLKRGVTLVLALALGDGVDLVDEKSAAPEAAPEPPKPPPPPTPKTKPAPSAPSAPSAEHAVRWAPWLAVSTAWGLTAKPALAPQIGLAVEERYWQALAQVTYAPARSAPEVQGIASSYSAVVGAAGGCVRLPLSAWSLAGCGVLEVGAVHGSSDGAYQDGAATAPWYAAGPLFVVMTPPVAGVALRAAGGFSVGFAPPHFAVRGLRDVYVVSPVVPTLSLGLSL